MTGRTACDAPGSLARSRLASALLPAPARAHEMTMAEMEVRETAPGEFFWQWSAAERQAPDGRRPDAALARGLRGGPERRALRARRV